MRVLLPILLLAFAAFAGCGGRDGASDGEIVVNSEPLVEVRSPDGTTQTVQEESSLAGPPEARRGHLAGLVVDSAIRPIEGAVVSIPGMDVEDATDRGGGFSFIDLVAGQYFLRAGAEGYATAQTVVEVKADGFVRVKFVLQPLPPPTPRHETQKFSGFADVTDSDLLFLYGWSCNACHFEFYYHDAGLRALVIEAAMEGYGGAGAGTVGSNGFYYELGGAEGGYGARIGGGSTANPMRVILQGPKLENASEPLALDVWPTSFPAPEISKSFEVYVTAWYNQEPPNGWSFLKPS